MLTLAIKANRVEGGCASLYPIRFLSQGRRKEIFRLTPNAAPRASRRGFSPPTRFYRGGGAPSCSIEIYSALSSLARETAKA